MGWVGGVGILWGVQMSDKKNDPKKKEQTVQVARMNFTYFPPATDLIKYGNETMWGKAVYDEMKKVMCLPHCKDWVMQFERAPTTGAIHMQGWVNLQKKQRVKAFGGLMGAIFKGITFSVSSNSGASAAQEYCMKDQTRVAGPYAKGNLLQYQQPSGWDLKDVRENPYPFQQKIYDDCKVKCKDDRTVNWVFDPKGCQGKSKLIKLLMHDKVALALQYGAAKDLMNLVINNPNQPAYVFDLTRAKPKDFDGDDLYSVMEAVKNGSVQNTKYQTGVLTMDPPHVWVFSNQLPNFEKLTGDRWKVWMINDKKELVEWDSKAGAQKPVRTQSKALRRAQSAPSSASSAAAAAPPKSKYIDVEAEADEDDEEGAEVEGELAEDPISQTQPPADEDDEAVEERLAARAKAERAMERAEEKRWEAAKGKPSEDEMLKAKYGFVPSHALRHQIMRQETGSGIFKAAMEHEQAVFAYFQTVGGIHGLSGDAAQYMGTCQHDRYGCKTCEDAIAHGQIPHIDLRTAAEAEQQDTAAEADAPDH